MEYIEYSNNSIIKANKSYYINNSYTYSDYINNIKTNGIECEYIHFSPIFCEIFLLEKNNCEISFLEYIINKCMKTQIINKEKIISNNYYPKSDVIFYHRYNCLLLNTQNIINLNKAKSISIKTIVQLLSHHFTKVV
jgi:hypothetical protein